MKKIPMLERFAAQSLVDYEGELIFSKEKFAELIVAECMHECLRMQLGNQYTPEELLFQTKYRKIIKEHFGVKE